MAELDYNFCESLIDELRDMEKFPGEMGKKNLVRALQTSPTKDFARKWVKDWIREHRKAPAAADIYKGTNAAHTLSKPEFGAFLPPLAPGEAPPEPEYNCDRCKDTGWYEVTSKIKPWDSQHAYTGVKKCLHPPQYRGKKASIY